MLLTEPLKGHLFIYVAYLALSVIDFVRQILIIAALRARVLAI